MTALTSRDVNPSALPGAATRTRAAADTAIRLVKVGTGDASEKE